ncbi:MAG: adenosine deaminase [Gracilimonas sp.]|uniref:adenosine deaminase n=1 Tax=Gracilimonas TaxID=649462 RepID=UPI001B2605A0|nr:adenosine deaminase [Gracilimonas sp.]MBO6586617.1 adenosine deaminase [Gracilimonas sp.]MBO6615274.1 adenosine deaminase [Gracilimonas sp.]
MNLNSLPKIELHLHLDCSLSFDVVKHLRPGITQEQYKSDFIAPANCSSLDEYLKCAQEPIALMQSKEQLEMVTLDLFQQLKKDHVIYAEIRFAPLQHCNKGLTAEEVVQAVDEATAKGINETGIEARIILCTLRHFTEEQSMQTVRLVEKFKGSRVTGFDIAADETLPVDNHIKAFEYANRNNIPCTAHAGEACGAESVREVLQNFYPSRIGHGVRSLEDDALMGHLKEQNIHLEVCPTSNVQTGIYDSVANHRVNEIYERGNSLSINTDGRTISNVSLNEEYSSLNKHFNWKPEHFFRVNHHAIDAAFCNEETKETLRRKLKDGSKND